MLHLRYQSIARSNRCCSILSHQLHTTVLTRDSKNSTEKLQPVKSIENKDGITEVYVVHRSKSGQLREKVNPKQKQHDKKPASSQSNFSARLRKLNTEHRLSEQQHSNIIESGWTRIPSGTKYERVEPPQKVKVATLAHGLEKVLFNPGVHYLKDPRSKQFNFTPFLEDITQPVDFDYDALTPYITSSRDNSLVNMAREMDQRYVGSTSSVSAALSHFYFVMSNFKEVNTSCLSRAFDNESTKFTRGTRTAASIYLRWKDGVYAVDADKSHDVDETVLSVMGKSMEKVLTMEPEDYNRLLKENSFKMTEQEKNQPESYAYGRLGKFLLRSQLDCYDSRLPRGTFDLKTRAAIPIRLDIANYTDYLGYSLKRAHGLYESFEREYYDMIRSAFLKYSFQVRIGHMDGILVAYHNTRKIFGFQYISREEMDSRLFGATKVGDAVFRNSLTMFEAVLDTATKKYPQQTLRISLDTRLHKSSGNASTDVYVEAVDLESPSVVPPENQHLDEFFQTEEVEDQSVLDPYRDISLYHLTTQSRVNGELVEGPLTMKTPSKDDWSLTFKLEESKADNEQVKTRFRKMRKAQADVYAPSTYTNPLLKKFKSMSEQTLHMEKSRNRQKSFGGHT